MCTGVAGREVELSIWELQIFLLFRSQKKTLEIPEIPEVEFKNQWKTQDIPDI